MKSLDYKPLGQIEYEKLGPLVTPWGDLGDAAKISWAKLAYRKLEESGTK